MSTPPNSRFQALLSAMLTQPPKAERKTGKPTEYWQLR
jgi:hypothetical protein